MALSLQQFVQALRESSALSPEEIASLEGKVKAQRPQPTAQDVAKELVKQGKLTKFQVVALFEGRAKSLLYGTYVVLDKIGAGGMGEVFKARHMRMKRTVALKILPAAVNRAPDVLRRFQREVEAAARLMHQNVVTAFDAGESHGVNFIAMEFVDGCDLASIVTTQGPLPVKQAVDCILQAARGLEYAHGEGMVHRDIKPANLLLDKKGTVKILDMGLARFDELFGGAQAVHAEGLTTTGQIMGTVDYMSPEQAEDTRKADHRADIYSLGCTLYRLLTGKVPFASETLMLKLLAHREHPIPSLRAARSDVPAELDNVLARMMAKLPQDRYQSMSEVITALQSCVSSAAATDASALSAAPDSEDVLSFLADEAPPAMSGIGRRSGASSGIGRRTAGASGIGRRASASGVGKRKESGSGIGRGGSTPSEPTLRSQAEEDTHRGAQPRQPRRAKRGLMIAGLGLSVVVLLGLIVAVLFTGGGETQTADAGKVATAPLDSPPVETPQNEKPADNTTVSPKPGEKPPVGNTTGETASQLGTSSPKPPVVTSTTTTTSPPAQPANPLVADPPGDKPDLLTTDAPVAVPPKTFDFEKPALPPTPTAPQTLVVGVEKGNHADLTAAIAKAKPGDTILIRHRGPLEFDPFDLTGKTPLTIVGDQKDGADFWPILKQKQPKPEEDRPRDGLFSAAQLVLTLRKLHLATHGPSQAKIDAIFALGSGRVELDQCTVTVGVRGRMADAAGDPIALVKTRIDAPGAVELVLNRTLLRGQRLRTCLQASGVPLVSVSATDMTWAGGQAVWLSGEKVSDLSLKLSACTIYNALSLVKWQVSPERQPSEKPAVDVRLERTLVVGAFGGKEPMFAWEPRSPGEDLTQAIAAGMVRWQDAGTVYDRYDGYYLDAKTGRVAPISKWQALWNQTGLTAPRELQPYLRTSPDGYELQEVAGRDLQPRWARAKTTGERPKEDVGANYQEQPPALAAILKRPVLTINDVAGQPRGTPRVLRVHPKLGPYKTLEGAFADLQDDEVIEIGDDGPYTPRRNFTVSPGSGVLSATVENLTVRAADAANPVIILRDDVQEGRDPVSPLFLFSTGYNSLSLDGLHIRFATGANTIRAATMCEGRHLLFRFTNGSIIDSAPGQGVSNSMNNSTGNVNFQTLAHYFRKGGNSDLKWLENNVYSHSRADQARYCFISGLENGNGQYFVLRNCIVKGDCMMWNALTSSAFNLEFNTLLGHVTNNDTDVRQLVYKCTANFVVSATSPFQLDPANMMQSVKVGADNALWLGNRPLTDEERKVGPNAFLPGPALKSPPTPIGSSTSKDPYARFRLKPGQTAARMAADGGTAGARVEHLPVLTALPPDFAR